MKYAYIIIFLTSFISSFIFAHCRSSLTKKMIKNENLHVPSKLPKGLLKNYALKMEILCPWKIERDFNGDGKLDWVGIIYKNKNYQLVSYLSRFSKYQLKILHHYPFFPDSMYIRVIRKREESSTKKRSVYHLLEVHLNQMSRIYTLKNKQLTLLKSYMDHSIDLKKEKSIKRL
jgi:hypothetical protein